jgi:hypothetical protein
VLMSNQEDNCTHCQSPLSPPEKAAYKGICEDCYCTQSVYLGISKVTANGSRVYGLVRGQRKGGVKEM